jgi:iron complex outermembrane receptor protein
VEIAAVYMPTRLWRISAGYSFLDMDLTLDADSLDDAQSRITRIEGQNPRQQAFIHLGTRLFNRYDFDLNVRYVDRLPAGNVPGYTVADIRLARQLSDNLELSLVGQNLFEDHHFEWSEGLVSEVEDSVYIKLLYRF